MGVGSKSPGTRIAVYGEIDPNLVDGSSVWLLSVCQVLASLPGVGVTLLLRRPLEDSRRFLLADLLADPSVEVLDAGRSDRLEPGEALEELGRLDRERGPFAVVVLRGQGVLEEAATGGRFPGRLWPYAMTGRGMSAETLRRLGALCSRLLCQTEAVAEELRSVIPEVAAKILVLPPMIPEATAPPPATQAPDGPLRLAYSGKLAPEYCWLETVDAFRRLREIEPAAELHVFGDKVHRPPDHPEFHAQAMRALTETGGLRWHGAVSRAAVGERLPEFDLALSIRDPGVEAAREISTKVLEYGAAGLPVVLNRAPAYERLLGPEYPLFIDRPEEAAEVLAGPARRGEVRSTAAAACYAASREFTFARVGERLAPHLPSRVAARPRRNGASEVAAGSPRVLIAGHDLKFTGPIRETIASAGAVISEDIWEHHAEHDEVASRRAIERADVILCEWCLGNAVWYSRNVRPDQRLVIRLHRVEVETDYPAAVEIDNVDKVVFVSQHIADEAIERFGWDSAKLCVVPNAVAVDRLRLPKRESARFALAMIGYIPRRKRLDRALDVLEELRRHQPEFQLHLVGHPPSELDWILHDPAEVEYFRGCFQRLQENDLLRGAVATLPFTNDLPKFLRGVGFVLSTSDSEGHQVSLAEGAASGSVPVILDRPGVADQYPQRWIHRSPRTAATALLALTESDLRAEAESASAHALSWSCERIALLWVDLLDLDTPRSR